VPLVVVVDTELRIIFADETRTGRLEKHSELDTGSLSRDLGDLGKRWYTRNSNIGAIVTFSRIEGRFPLRWQLFRKKICHLWDWDRRIDALAGVGVTVCIMLDGLVGPTDYLCSHGIAEQSMAHVQPKEMPFCLARLMTIWVLSGSGRDDWEDVWR
jgi:hypothetical protein